MKFSYLHMIWDVKIYLAKIKDCKGRDYMFSTKKTLLTITRPKKQKIRGFTPSPRPRICLKSWYEKELLARRLPDPQP